MGKWKLMKICPITAKETWGHFDGKKIRIQERIPVEKLIQQNTIDYNNSYSHKDGSRKVASVPLNLWFEKLYPAILQDDKKFIKDFFNNSDNRKFRTHRSRL